ncbi:hypothetical protein LTR08_005929 [Meristemomyces frigidus]|nr:hypothetical protein LTR08_005929 [Meristemomyces frigidus]
MAPTPPDPDKLGDSEHCQHPCAEENKAVLDAQSNAIAERNDQESPLLKLIGELRNEISRYVVLSPDPIALKLGRREGKSSILDCQPPPLALVCRKLYDEVTPIYWAENEFRLGAGSGYRGQERSMSLNPRSFKLEVRYKSHWIMKDLCFCWVAQEAKVTDTLLLDMVEDFMIDDNGDPDAYSAEDFPGFDKETDCFRCKTCKGDLYGRGWTRGKVVA